MPSGAGGSIRRYSPRAKIDVDVIDADCGLAQAHLARARAAGTRDRLDDELAGPPKVFDAPSACTRSSRRARAAPARWPRAGARRRPGGDGGAGPRSPPRRRCRPTMPASSASRPGGVSKVDCHCQKVRLPSVTGLEPQGRDIVEQRHRRVEDAVGRDVLAVRQRDQLLAHAGPRRAGGNCARSRPGRAPRRSRSAISATAGCQRSWLLKSRSISQTALDRRVDDGASASRAAMAAQRCPNWLLSASKPPWKTPWPIELGQLALLAPGGESNSADHSAEVRLPSVIGVSLRVAI